MNTVESEIQAYPFFINGKWVVGTGKQTWDAVNPSNGEVFAKVYDASREDVLEAISCARAAFDSGVWSGLSIEKRGEYLARIAQLIRDQAKVLAQLETLSTGKTSKQTTFIDVPTCADTFEYFSKAGSELKEHVNPVCAPVKSVTVHEPMGVVGCIIPWNYPLIMAAWKIAPALLAGNTIVFKPSTLASVSILKLAEIFEQAKLPSGVVNIITPKSHDAALEMVRSRDVDMISFTGGNKTGQEIMRLAAETTKKLSLELGGKSPNIVLEDCDMEAAVGGSLSAIFMNQGQMCTAGSRLLIDEKIADEFLVRMVEKVKQLKIGPAHDYATDFGPVISASGRDRALQAIEQAKTQGARLLCGGAIAKSPDLGNGFYLEPTIFDCVKPDMDIAKHEIFGPVLAVITFKTIAQAIEIANHCEYGLASCVWTRSQSQAQDIARKLKCGTVWVNTYGGFYNEASFGGYKQSGFGRELGREGLLAYTQSKHICIDETPGGRPLVASWF